MKILAMASCCVDIYPQFNAEHVGGNSLNFATQCRREGMPEVSVVGCVGNDNHGRRIKDHLLGHGIDASHLHAAEGPSATHVVLVTPDGRNRFPYGSWKGGVYQDFRLSADDWAFVAEHDAVAMPSLDPNFHDALEHLAGERKLVVDFLDTRDFDLFEACLPHVAMAFISGDESVAKRFSALSDKTDVPLVVTMGNRGSAAFLAGRSYERDVVTPRRVVDPTGCGDAYEAAFMVSWCCDGDVKLAMTAGAEAAAEIVGRLGAV